MTNLVRMGSPVKKLLQEWLDNDEITEVVLLGKLKGNKVRWSHSSVTSTFWWMGFLHHVADLMSNYASGGE